jgi:hypothetical protein
MVDTGFHKSLQYSNPFNIPHHVCTRWALVPLPICEQMWWGLTQCAGDVAVQRGLWHSFATATRLPQTVDSLFENFVMLKRKEHEMSFLEELTALLNKHSMEASGGNTPDYILAKYLLACLDAFDAAVRLRQEWYEKDGNTN